MAQGELVGGDLKDKLSKADSKVNRLESALSVARKERDDLATAYRVLVKLGHIEDGGTPADTTPSTGANEKQAIVLELVPFGEQYAVAPKDVTAILHNRGLEDITADYVRTTLWRFAQRNVLQSGDGLYWRRTPELNSVAAPDAETSRADNESTGPATGRGTGFPPTPPEGSIPSGSTPSNTSPGWGDDLEDDIPF